MATLLPNTNHRKSAPATSMLPGAARVISNNSFEAMLAQYDAARYRQSLICNAMRGAQGARASTWERVFSEAVNETIERADDLVAAPAPTIMAFAQKLEAVRRDGDWDEHADALIAEASRLGEGA